MRLERGPSGFTFSEPEIRLIYQVVSDYANLLGGPGALRRNVALSIIRQEWTTPDGSFNALYSPWDHSITLPPDWYHPIIANLPGGRGFIIQLANPCAERMLDFPEGSLPTEESEAKFILAHEMGHAFSTGNREALPSFRAHVDLPFLAWFDLNPLISRNAGRDRFEEEVFADVLAAYLYSQGLLNQQMLDWIRIALPGVLR